MRIGMYAGRLPAPGRKPGGGEVYIHRVAEALTRRGHDVTVLAYGRGCVEHSYAVRWLRPAMASSNRPVKKYLASWQLNWTDVTPFDVFHLHGDDWFYHRRSVPTVRTFHGSALFESLNAKSLRHRVDQAVVFMLELRAAKLADACYAVGNDARAIYRADGLLNCGIESPTEPRVPADAPIISFIGTWGGRKRGELLHDAFQRVIRPAFPTAELVMVCDRCDAGPGVRWLANPTDEEITTLLLKSWVFCLPSIYEGFGIPYLEALASGVPVVATPNPGAEDLLRPGECGLLVSEDELGEAIVDLLADDAKRERLSRAGRMRAGDYSWDRVVSQHELAYARAIERWRGDRSTARALVSSLPPSG